MQKSYFFLFKWINKVKFIIQKYVIEIIISSNNIHIKISPGDSSIAKGINVVEARRVELLSNYSFILASPSTVCYFISQYHSSTNKRIILVASFYPLFLKQKIVLFPTILTPFISRRFPIKRVATLRQLMLLRYF